MQPAQTQLRPGEPPTVAVAIDRVVDAAENVVADQVELARLELRQLLAGAARGGALVLVGAFLLALAWTAVVGAAYVLLADRFPAPERLGLIAAVNGAGGIALAALGARRLAAREDHGGH